MQRVSCLFVRLSFCYNLDNKQFMKFYLTYRMAGKQTKNIVNQKRVKLQIMSQGYRFKHGDMFKVCRNLYYLILLHIYC